MFGQGVQVSTGLMRELPAVPAGQGLTHVEAPGALYVSK